MQTENDASLSERIARLESALVDVSRRLDEHLEATRAPATAARLQRPAPRPAVHFAPSVQSRGADWWLARGGAALTLVALVLLYQYAVDHNWITPVLRIAVGTGIGAILMIASIRLSRARADMPDDSVGLREVLMGSALAAWYITAYAAAVFYGLIPMSTARIIFLALSVAGSWLAMREKRALLALLALGVGFATPALLPSPNPSIPQFSIYLGALGAVGLILYLMRGWQSVLWLTFGAFWWSAGAATSIACCSAAASRPGSQTALSILIVLGGAAMVRAPILRRLLLALGSPLYTESRRSEAATSILTEIARKLGRITGLVGGIDSPALWVVTLLSPIVAIAQLSLVWPRASFMIWGAVSFAAAALAYRLAQSHRAPDEEFSHVEMAAVALWSLAGILWLARALPDDGDTFLAANLIIGASVHAIVSLQYARKSHFMVPVRLAMATVLAILLAILTGESNARGLEPYWTLAAVAGIGVALRAAWLYRRGGMIGFAGLAAGGAYIALLVVDARVLGSVFRPLVTASYAIAGTALLVAGRNSVHGEWVRRAGGLTLIVVVARLVLVDMAGVDTIWRVLLFLGCGALFLVTSSRMRTSALRVTEQPPPSS